MADELDTTLVLEHAMYHRYQAVGANGIMCQAVDGGACFTHPDGDPEACLLYAVRQAAEADE